MSTVVKVEDLSKQYRLGKIGTGTLSHDLNRWWHNVRGKQDPYLKIGQLNDRQQKSGKNEYVWALKDINFEVKQGDVVGIIGRNGAGKSTLLKILSRTTTPTTGSVKVKGRIASLLEVGTGFHPELTGRENVFLNGAILGMRRAEIKGKFDEIVDFAGITKYIDTPVKRYSSGMYVRLAFAVAAYLDPEILIVDEVLAVGDAEFQKKALGKMQDVSQEEGRTVLFVSHNIASIQSLCNSAMLLANGALIKTGETDEILNLYLKHQFSRVETLLSDRLDRKGSFVVKFETVWFENTKGQTVDLLYSGMECFWCIKVLNTTSEIQRNVIISVGIDDSHGRRLAILSNTLTDQPITLYPGTSATIKIRIDSLPFKGATYYFTLFASVNEVIADWVTQAGRVTVESGDYFRTGKVVPESQGNILVKHDFIS